MLTVRPIEQKDAQACSEIINHTISLGGTTAYEEPFSVDGFDQNYREDTALCFVVEQAGRVVGFQGLFDVGEGVLSVGSFTDQQNPVKGAGRALIEHSVKAAKEQGFQSIIAKITSDNASGLGYYSRSGFIDDYVIERDHQRADGRWVDRIVKRMAL